MLSVVVSTLVAALASAFTIVNHDHWTWPFSVWWFYVVLIVFVIGTSLFELAPFTISLELV